MDGLQNDRWTEQQNDGWIMQLDEQNNRTMAGWMDDRMIDGQNDGWMDDRMINRTIEGWMDDIQ